MKRFLPILLLITFSFPLLILLMYSITFNFPYPNLIPNSFTLRAFNEIFSLHSLNITLQSIYCSILVSILTIILCVPASRALSFGVFKGKSLFLLLFTSPLILPLASITMGIHILFIRLNITNTIIGVVLINTIPCIPYATRLITNVMLIVGREHELVARSLGASSIKSFFIVTFPMLIPGITSCFSFIFIISFSQYFTTFLIGGGNITTIPIVMIPYIQSGNRTLASGYCLLFIFSALIVLIIIEKLIEKYYAKDIKTID